MTLTEIDPVSAHGSASDELWRRLQGYRSAGRPLVVGIDGASGSGKTHLANALAAHDGRTAVVHTDDIAWHHSFFGWRHLLVDGLLEPLHDGRLPIRYTPRAWRRHGRAGAITIPVTTTTVIVEGVGAAARDVRRLLDVVVWVDVDDALARDRVAARGVDTDEFIADWTVQERVFLAEHRPWEIADEVFDGRS